MPSEKKERIALLSGLHTDALTEVSISPLPSSLNPMKQYVKPKDCFRNAFRVATHEWIDVVIGVIDFKNLGIAIEHAWVFDKKTGLHYDPTLELFAKQNDDSLYYQFVTIGVDEYLNMQQLLNLGNVAISLTDFRKHPELSRHFTRGKTFEQMGGNLDKSDRNPDSSLAKVKRNTF